MAVSYNGLWKLLIDRNMKKMDLVENENIGISNSTLAKMSKGENVSMSILEKICMEFDCDFGDIISIEKSKQIFYMSPFIGTLHFIKLVL